ncbi:MAG: DNA-binding protein [Candidatus Competibacteraceae bacterium]
MARPGITYEEVSRTAAQLLEQGLHPSVQRVRATLGTGSNTTISDYLQRWQQELKVSPKLALPPEMPQPLIQALETIWRTALEQADATYQEQRDQAAQAVVTANQARDEALAQANHSRAELVTSQHRLAELQSTSRELEKQLLLESERRQVAESHIVTVEQQLVAAHRSHEHTRQETQLALSNLEATLEQARKDAKQQLAADEERLRHERERGEANEVRLLRLIEQTRSDHTAERSRLEAALQDSRQREAILQERLALSRQEHERLGSTLVGTTESKRLLEIELERLRQEKQEMETLHLQATRQAEYLRGEVEASNRERQALELALKYCQQALHACQHLPSPASEFTPPDTNPP